MGSFQKLEWCDKQLYLCICKRYFTITLLPNTFLNLQKRNLFHLGKIYFLVLCFSWRIGPLLADGLWIHKVPDDLEINVHYYLLWYSPNFLAPHVRIHSWSSKMCWNLKLHKQECENTLQLKLYPPTFCQVELVQLAILVKVSRSLKYLCHNINSENLKKFILYWFKVPVPHGPHLMKYISNIFFKTMAYNI